MRGLRREVGKLLGTCKVIREEGRWEDEGAEQAGNQSVLSVSSVCLPK